MRSFLGRLFPKELLHQLNSFCLGRQGQHHGILCPRLALHSASLPPYLYTRFYNIQMTATQQLAHINHSFYRNFQYPGHQSPTLCATDQCHAKQFYHRPGWVGSVSATRKLKKKGKRKKVFILFSTALNGLVIGDCCPRGSPGLEQHKTENVFQKADRFKLILKGVMRKG